MADLTEIVAGSVAIAGGIFLAMKKVSGVDKRPKPMTAADVVREEMTHFSDAMADSMNETKRHNAAVEAESRRSNDALEKVVSGMTEILRIQAVQTDKLQHIETGIDHLRDRKGDY